MSIMHCERCALAVDTDWDTETLYEGLCAVCSDHEGEWHPHGTYCVGYDDDVIEDDNAQRCADINEVLR